MCHGGVCLRWVQIYQDLARRGILSSTGILLRNVLVWGLLSLLGVTPGDEALNPENVASPTLWFAVLLARSFAGISNTLPPCPLVSHHVMYCYRGERPGDQDQRRQRWPEKRHGTNIPRFGTRTRTGEKE